MNSSEVMIMRATQRKRISLAVVRKSVGKKARSSGVSSGQPRVANGQIAELNQVSSTSSSCSQPSPSRRLLADVDLLAPVPDRQPVSPPELPGDAPGPDPLHPVEIDLAARSRG